jgi:hypothetical protein
MIKLKPNTDPDAIEHKIVSLRMLIDQAENKRNHLDMLRQKNFSVTLFIFAGLFGFGLSQGNIVLQIFLVIVLAIFMIVLSDYDHSLHKSSHGWQYTRKELIGILTQLINDNSCEVEFKVYYKEGEKKAETENCSNFSDLMQFWFNRNEKAYKGPSRMRVIYFIFIIGAVLCILPFLLTHLKS